LLIGLGESLLVDTGWPDIRDVERIKAAMHDGGITRSITARPHFHHDQMWAASAAGQSVQ